MDSIVINGGRPLYGCVHIQGSKNAVLPLISASLLCENTILTNCPRILDVYSMIDILEKIGMKSFWIDENALVIQRVEDVEAEIAPNLTGKLRASILLAGTLLGKYRKVFLAYPGGCTIGERPIGMHIKAFEELGAKVTRLCDGIDIDGSQLHGGSIMLEFPSVGATENILLLASQISEEVVLHNAAKEPEIDELIQFLNVLGYNIKRIDNIIRINGKQRENNIEYCVCPDRIVAGTYILATIATVGEIEIKNAPVNQLGTLLEKIDEMGSRWRLDKSGSLFIMGSSSVSPVNIITNPYPDFPTDLQSQIMTVLTSANGQSIIKENIFEDRFKIVPELIKMGADIVVDGKQAYVYGNSKLYGRNVIAKDLRGTAALIIAGLMAKGETVVLETDFVKRGYSDICMDLRGLGANISYG